MATGRRSKATVEEKKRIIFDYYLNCANANPKSMQKYNIYQLIASYAQENGYELKYYDFSRVAAVKDYILSLSSTAEEPVSLAAYTPIDVEYFCRPDITPKDRRAILLEQDAYCKKLYLKASKVLEDVERLQEENQALKQRISNLQHESDNRESYTALQEKIRHLKKYIMEYVDYDIAMALLNKEESTLPNNSPKAQELIGTGDPTDELNIKEYHNTTPTDAPQQGGKVLDLFDFM